MIDSKTAALWKTPPEHQEPGRVYCHEGYAEGTHCPLKFTLDGRGWCHHRGADGRPDCILRGPIGSTRSYMQSIAEVAQVQHSKELLDSTATWQPDSSTAKEEL